VGEPQQKYVSLNPGYHLLMQNNIISHRLEVPTSLELIENWEEVTRFVVEEAFDDFLASNFAKDIQYVANCMGQRN
jgi:hypothetical protein